MSVCANGRDRGTLCQCFNCLYFENVTKKKRIYSGRVFLGFRVTVNKFMIGGPTVVTDETGVQSFLGRRPSFVVLVASTTPTRNKSKLKDLVFGMLLKCHLGSWSEKTPLRRDRTPPTRSRGVGP